MLQMQCCVQGHFMVNGNGKSCVAGWGAEKKNKKNIYIQWWPKILEHLADLKKNIDLFFPPKHDFIL